MTFSRHSWKNSCKPTWCTDTRIHIHTDRGTTNNLLLKVVGDIGIVDHFAPTLLHSGSVFGGDFAIVIERSKFFFGKEFDFTTRG